MKINFGTLKGRSIFVGKNEKMRPTTSIAKDKIFNILKINENDIVLDIFAGTGSLGLESLSLGAKKAIFLDNNIESFKAINKNLKEFDFKDSKIYFGDFRTKLKSLKEKFTIIFLDPPFSVEKYYDEALILILKKELLEKNGIIVLEKNKKLKISLLKDFNIINEKNVGEKDILFLSLKNE